MRKKNSFLIIILTLRYIALQNGLHRPPRNGVFGDSHTRGAGAEGVAAAGPIT